MTYTGARFCLNRRVGQKTNFDVGSHKTRLKKVKSSIKLQNVFRRVSQGGGVSVGKSSSDGNNNTASDQGQLFGVALAELCGEEHRLPTPVSALLRHILENGPATVGIFRRSPNARVTKDLREKLDKSKVRKSETKCQKGALSLVTQLVRIPE